MTNEGGTKRIGPSRNGLNTGGGGGGGGGEDLTEYTAPVLDDGRRHPADTSSLFPSFSRSCLRQDGEHLSLWC